MSTCRIVGCRHGEAREPGTYPILLWSAHDDAPVGLGSVCGAIRRCLVTAAEHPQTTFEVAENAFTGRFDLDPRHYAEAFCLRPNNVVVPEHWEALFPRVVADGRMRLIIAGSRLFDDAAFLAQRLERMCERFAPERILGISGGARGADQLGEQ